MTTEIEAEAAPPAYVTMPVASADEAALMLAAMSLTGDPEAGFVQDDQGALTLIIPASTPADAIAAARAAIEDGSAALEARRAAANAECGRRISAHASEATQRNMALYAGLLALVPAANRTAAQKADVAALFEAGAWVEAMRARWPEIAADGLDPTDDANWPEPTASAVALAARF